jgi:TRAP-type C4-dicarboxylate transport system permease small subunit
MKTFNEFIGNAEKVISGFFLLLTTTMAFFQVLNRYFFHFEIMGIGDLCVYAYMVCLFFGFAYVSYEGTHTSVEIIQNRLEHLKNVNIHRFYCVFLDVISIIIVVTFMFPLYSMSMKAMKYPEWGALISWFNQSWLVYILFFTVSLCLFHKFIILWKKLIPENGK